jgi:hypothetical protein
LIDLKIEPVAHHQDDLVVTRTTHPPSPDAEANDRAIRESVERLRDHRRPLGLRAVMTERIRPLLDPSSGHNDEILVRALREMLHNAPTPSEGRPSVSG